MKTRPRLLVAALAALAAHSAAVAKVTGAKVERPSAAQLDLTWTDANPVDIYEADRPDARLKDAHELVRGARDGAYHVRQADRSRRYFILVDQVDRSALTVAERVVPLAQGSNFRDIGGYVGAGGKHVRWGLIYRSGGQAMLTPDDVARVKALGVTQLVDLRSSEERAIGPTRIAGVPYAAVGYSLIDMVAGTGGSQLRNGADVYRNFPVALAPQMRLIFAGLLSGRGPIVYNCSAGQDRTGFATAVILSALGVPREVIVADYHLSTVYRRPEFEMGPLDPASTDPVVKLFAQYRQRPDWRTPEPLKAADGSPYLAGAFAEIDAKWGSVERYLQDEVGVGAADIQTLRRLYLE